MMRIYWSLLICLFALNLKAPDPHFSQYYANPLYLNPAFAGSERCPRFIMNYRNQFPAFGAYQTYSASYDQYSPALNGGLGLMVLRDDAGNGTLTSTEVSGIYSYHLKVSRKFFILAGFQATFRQRSLNWGSFTFPDQIDPVYGFVLQELPAHASFTYDGSHQLVCIFEARRKVKVAIMTSLPTKGYMDIDSGHGS